MDKAAELMMDKAAELMPFLDLAKEEARSLEEWAREIARTALTITGFSGAMVAFGTALLGGHFAVPGANFFAAPVATFVALVIPTFVILVVDLLIVFPTNSVPPNLRVARKHLSNYPFAPIIERVIDALNTQNDNTRNRLHKKAELLKFMAYVALAQFAVLPTSAVVRAVL